VFLDSLNDDDSPASKYSPSKQSMTKTVFNKYDTQQSKETYDDSSFIKLHKTNPLVRTHAKQIKQNTNNSPIKYIKNSKKIRSKMSYEDIVIGGRKIRRVMSPPLTSSKLFSFVASPSGHSVKKVTQQTHKNVNLLKLNIVEIKILVLKILEIWNPQQCQ
jgi:hypothetical protein